MLPIELLLIGIVVVMALASLPIWLMVGKEVSRTKDVFEKLAQHFNGNVIHLPLGVMIPVGSQISAKVYVLQGQILFSAPIQLVKDPGVLILRTLKFLRKWKFMHYCLGRKEVAFHQGIDDLYVFQARESTWLKSIISDDMIKRLNMDARIIRIQISGKKILASMRIWKWDASVVPGLINDVQLLRDLANVVHNSDLSQRTTE